MELLRSIVAAPVQLLLRPFAGDHPLLTLIPIGVLAGVAMLWAFRVLSNQKAISDTKRRLSAHLYEMRLFVDEPKLILKAQAALLRDNARYLGLMLVPALVMTVPLALLYLQLDTFYGYSPLKPGEASLLTVQLRSEVPADAGAIRLEAPDWIAADAPPVRAVADRQISWRIRPSRVASGELRVTVGQDSVSKSITAGSGPEFVSVRRVSSPAELLLHPAEPQLAASSIEWIEADFRSADVELLGIRLHWSIWFFAIAMITAFFLRGRFGVSF